MRIRFQIQRATDLLAFEDQLLPEEMRAVLVPMTLRDGQRLYVVGQSEIKIGKLRSKSLLAQRTAKFFD